MKTPEHLGGHGGITHVDSGAIAWARRTLGIKSVVDVGCGVGDMVKIMLDFGLDAMGIEGDPLLNWGRPEKFVRHDFTKGKCIIPNMPNPDLGWCVEVLEHIEEEYLPNVFYTFRNCEYVIVTAAPPGTEAAHHHVNCKDQDYWIEKFHEFGFDFAFDLTAQLRASSTMQRNFMRENGMVFVRNLELDQIPDDEIEVEIDENPFDKEVYAKTEEDSFTPDPDLYVPPDTNEVLHPITNEPLPPNKGIIKEDGKLYMVTFNKSGTVRKGSKKLIEE